MAALAASAALALHRHWIVKRDTLVYVAEISVYMTNISVYATASQWNLAQPLSQHRVSRKSG